MEIDLLSSRSPEWAALLDRSPHDFYHLPAYAELSARLDGGAAGAVLVRDGVRTLLLPYIARPIPGADDTWDATSPYGYPGPLVSGADDRGAFAADALDAATERLRAERCVSLFVRLHPILGPAPQPSDALLVQHGETVHVDLRKSESEHWTETMSGHRNEINRAMKAGHQAYFDDGFRHADRFVEIYRSTMSRVGAAAQYFFDRDYLMGLREAVGPRLRLAVVEIDGTVAAAGLFVETGKIVQYHLSGTDEAFRHKQPTKLMLHFVRGWARERGATWLHLGGGVGGAEDSLFKFKAGFSKARTPFFTLRVVVNQAVYRALCRAKHPDADATELGGFFPLYRRP
jgi:CelD/BcsL family acetyltransferase involved in cellulose biosynthesis